MPTIQLAVSRSAITLQWCISSKCALQSFLVWQHIFSAMFLGRRYLMWQIIGYLLSSNLWCDSSCCKVCHFKSLIHSLWFLEKCYCAPLFTKKLLLYCWTMIDKSSHDFTLNSSFILTCIWSYGAIFEHAQHVFIRMLTGMRLFSGPAVVTPFLSPHLPTVEGQTIDLLHWNLDKGWTCRVDHNRAQSDAMHVFY